MKRYIYLLCILSALFLSACQSSGSAIPDSTDGNQNEESIVDTQEWKYQFADIYGITDAEIADQYLEIVTDLLESGNSPAIKALFSDSTLTLVNSIDNQIDELMHFYQGEMVSYERFGPISSYSKDGDHFSVIIRGSYDIKTTEGSYRISFKANLKDTDVPAEIGLHSLYIIKAEDSNMEYAYWCSEDAIPGIIIEEGDITENQVISAFFEALENQNKEAIEQLFAMNVQTEIDLNMQLDALFDFYNGTLGSYQRVGSYYRGEKPCYHMESYEVSTAEEGYRIAMKICYRDSSDSGNVGIHSIYIIKAEKADPDFVYWGNHSWKNGIIIEDAGNS